MICILTLLHFLIIAIAGIINLVTLIPMSINYILFSTVIPIVIIVIILFWLCNKYYSYEAQKAAILYFVFSLLSFLCMLFIDNFLESRLADLVKSYYVSCLSGILIIVAISNLLFFISYIIHVKNAVNNNSIEFYQDFGQIIQNQTKDNQVKNEEEKNNRLV